MKNQIDLIGNTPLIRLFNLERKYNLNAEIYVKLENYNLTGSIKDRPAKFILEDLKKQNLLIPNQTKIVAATSGNFGISLAFLAKYYKYKFICVMPKKTPKKVILLIKKLNAKVILTSKYKKMKGAIKKAEEIVKNNKNCIKIDQFNNCNNLLSHYKTTAREIYNNIKDIDYFISGIGSGGTISGIGNYLKEKINNLKIIGVKSDLNNKITGIGTNFVSNILNENIIDDYFIADYKNAIKYKKEILNSEMLDVGISSGANLECAIDIALKTNKRIKIVTVFPDRGDRYNNDL